jgi:hypothetical protein
MTLFFYSLHETTVERRQVLENTTRTNFLPATKLHVSEVRRVHPGRRKFGLATEKGEGPPALPRMFNCQLLARLDPD